jgi:hypothetical protein
MILLTDKVWTDRAAIPRRVEIVHFALLLPCVLRLETLDEIDKIASFHKSGDDGANSLQRPGYDSEFFCVHGFGLFIRTWKAELAL